MVKFAVKGNRSWRVEEVLAGEGLPRYTQFWRVDILDWICIPCSNLGTYEPSPTNRELT